MKFLETPVEETIYYGWSKMPTIARFLCKGLLAALYLFPAAVFAQPEAGTLEIRIKDHRDAIGDFSRLDIKIESIAVSTKSGLGFWQAGWRDLKPSPDTADLTQYVGNKTLPVFRGAVEPAGFNGFHLKLRSINGVLKKAKRSAPVKNTVGPVKVPFEVLAKGETVLVIDLTVMDMSDHPPRGYELEIKVYELITNGKLLRKVPPA
jgi:hypothetical protein